MNEFTEPVRILITMFIAAGAILMPAFAILGIALRIRERMDR